MGHQWTMGGGDMGQDNFIISLLKRHKIDQKHWPNSLEYVMAFIIFVYMGITMNPVEGVRGIFRCVHVGFNVIFPPLSAQ